MTRLPGTDRARSLLGKRGAFEGVARWPRMASGMGTDEARSTTTNQPRHSAQRVVEKVGRSGGKITVGSRLRWGSGGLR